LSWLRCQKVAGLEQKILYAGECTPSVDRALITKIASRKENCDFIASRSRM